MKGKITSINNYNYGNDRYYSLSIKIPVESVGEVVVLDSDVRLGEVELKYIDEKKG